VKKRAAGLDKAEGKQRIKLNCMTNSSKPLSRRMVGTIGDCYTPVEVVDLIISLGR